MTETETQLYLLDVIRKNHKDSLEFLRRGKFKESTFTSGEVIQAVEILEQKINERRESNQRPD